MLKYFLDNNLISPKQSGFRPGDSCINQLLSITRIFTSFDNGLDVRGVFLDISKAFDKVWQDGWLKSEKSVPNHTHHCILMTIPFTKFKSKST